MGKLADIEKLKLRATYFNNISVGLFLGGVLIPFLAVVQHAGDIVTDLTGGKFLSFKDLTATIGTLVAIGMAFHGGKAMQRNVRETIDQIKDELPSEENSN
jgi:hypothetical protein